MYFDTHIHSVASPDSDMQPSEVMRRLSTLGLGGIFTEHVDFAEPTEGRDFTANDAPTNMPGDFVVDFDMYPAQYESLRSDTLLLGLEIGMNKAFLPLNTQTASAYPYDYILGSVHTMDGLDIIYAAAHFSTREQARRFLEYNREMLELYTDIDALGHIDYLARENSCGARDCVGNQYKSFWRQNGATNHV
jgi:histidinol-phosphatase (PHP family)